MKHALDFRNKRRRRSTDETAKVGKYDRNATSVDTGAGCANSRRWSRILGGTSTGAAETSVL